MSAQHYVYLDNRKTAGVYTVGFYAPDGQFNPESDHDTAAQAAQRVHFLHGGTPLLPRTGLCPACGKQVSLHGITQDGRLIGSCRDAFTVAKWLE